MRRDIMKYLIVLIALILPAYLVRFSLLGIPTTLLEVVIYAVFIYGLSNMAFSQWHRAKSKAWFVIGLFLLASLISVWIAPDKLKALGELKAWFIDPILIVWLILSWLEVKHLPLLMGALFASSLFISVHTIIQKLTGMITPDGRVIGLFGYSPNYLALFLAPITTLGLVYFIEIVLAKQKQLFFTRLLVGSLVLAINLVAIYFSGSRGGMLAVLGGVAAYLSVKYWPEINARLWRKLAFWVALAVMAVGLFFAFKPNLAASGDNGGRTATSNNIRYEIWHTSLEIARQKPILGVGLGNFQAYFSDLTKNRINYPEYISPWALTPHNLYLMIWLEMGILGLAAFLGLIVYFFRALAASSDKKTVLVLMAAMVTILVQGVVDTPYFKNDLSLIFWLIFSAALLLEKENKAMANYRDPKS